MKHIRNLQSPCSLTTLCGRRVGTPGGKIFPGVDAETPDWFDRHPYPDALDGKVCKQCLNIRNAKLYRRTS